MKILPAGNFFPGARLTLLAAVVFCLAPPRVGAQFAGPIAFVAGSDGSLRAEGVTEGVTTASPQPLWTQTLATGYINGIAINNGFLFGANTAAAEVEEFNAATGATVVSNFITFTSSDPQSIASDGTNLFVATQNGMVSEYNGSNGSIESSDFISEGIVTGLACYDGLLYVVGGSLPNMVSVYNAATLAVVNPALVTAVGGSGIAVDAQGIFISGGGGASSYSLSGSSITPNLITGLGFATGIAADGNDLFIEDYRNNAVLEYDTSGDLINSLLITVNGPTAILVVPEPATWSLLAGGAALLFAAWHRRTAVRKAP